MKKNRKKIIRRVLIALLLVVTIGLFYVANYLVTYGIARQGDGGDRQPAKPTETVLDKDEIYYINKSNYDTETSEFLETNTLNKENMNTKDNLDLNIYSLKDPKNHNWVLLIHGYRSKHENVLNYGVQYFKNGFNAVMPDLRASGTSEGDYIGMGILDVSDMKLLIENIIKEDPLANIVVHGISMGAATTMNLSNTDLPSNVKLFIEDSGYTSVWDVFSQELSYRFNLPEFPLLHVGSFISKLRAGYSFKEVSTINNVRESDKPILFIHGKEDDFIPFYMMEELYEAKVNGNKDLLVSERADHANSMYFLGQEYWDKVFEFINNNLN